MKNPDRHDDHLSVTESGSSDDHLKSHLPDQKQQYADAWIRTEWLIGREGLNKLRSATIAIFGLGGVGSYAAESLCRSGVGRLILFDHDRVAPSNLNRQLIATHQTINQLKVKAARDRLLSINPDCDVLIHPLFWPAEMTPEISRQYLPESTDYIIDAIDTVSAKLNLVMIASARDIPIISCMGTGNKLDPGRLCLTDLYQTQTCPLARIMRREGRKLGINSLKVVYSTELPRKPIRDPLPEPAGIAANGQHQKPGPASIAFVPGSAGLMLAAAVVRDLLQENPENDSF